MILLEIESRFFNLEGQSISISVRLASILKPLNSDVFVSIKDLVACFAGYAKLPPNCSHLLAVEKLFH